MAKSEKETLDGTTEERIKEAARKVFTQKGYAAARVRDIAEEAGINIALLSYYFRGKEKLFDLVMLENLEQFAGSLHQIIDDESTSLREKLERIVAFYIDLFIAQPALPLFILSEMRTHPEKLVKRLAGKQMLNSCFIRQLRDALRMNGVDTHPMQILMSLLGMMAFPFIARPMLESIASQQPADFEAMMRERKQLIPHWVEALLLAK